MLSLHSTTDAAWLERVQSNLEELLIDHAHCEKKAAGVAMNLIFHYVEYEELCREMTLIVNEERVWLSRVTRVLILVPWAVPPIVNGLLWSFILNAQYGYLNRVLSALGLIDGYVNWLGNPALAMAAVIAAYVWRTTPFNILLYHAALQGIPRELYEAAEVDGASGWSAFWSLTLPLLRPILAVTLVLRTTFAFMVFDEILAITQGGPGNDTWVAAWYTYKMSFQPPFNIGLGAASAWGLTLIIGAVALLYVRFVYRRVEW